MFSRKDNFDLICGFRIITLFGRMVGSTFLKFCAVLTELEISQNIRGIFPIRVVVTRSIFFCFTSSVLSPPSVIRVTMSSEISASPTPFCRKGLVIVDVLLIPVVSHHRVDLTHRPFYVCNISTMDLARFVAVCRFGG